MIKQMVASTIAIQSSERKNDDCADPLDAVESAAEESEVGEAFMEEGDSAMVGIVLSAGFLFEAEHILPRQLNAAVNGQRATGDVVAGRVT